MSLLNIFKYSLKEKIIFLLFPFLFSTTSFFYIRNQPDLYRISINVDLQNLERRDDLRNLACSVFIQTDVFKKMHKSAQGADFWLSELPLVTALKDKSCFNINSLALIIHYLHYYNTSNIFPALNNDPNFIDYLNSKKLTIADFERQLSSRISFLIRQDSLFLTIAMKGEDVNEMRFLLKLITEKALKLTQEDIAKSWTTILFRLKSASELSSVIDAQKTENKIEAALNEKVGNVSPKWNEQYFTEKIGPNKIAVVVFGFFCGLLFSFFLIIFLRREGRTE